MCSKSFYSLYIREKEKDTCQNIIMFDQPPHMRCGHSSGKCDLAQGFVREQQESVPTCGNPCINVFSRYIYPVSINPFSFQEL